MPTIRHRHRVGALAALLVIAAWWASAGTADGEELPPSDCVGVVDDLGFGQEPTTVTAESTDPLCLDLPGAADGDVIRVRMTGTSWPRWTVTDGGGAAVCGSDDDHCVLDGTGPWTLDVAPGRSGSIDTSVFRLNDPTGCSEYSGTGSFEDAPEELTVHQLGDVCVSLDTGEDQKYWTVSTASVLVTDPTGQPICHGRGYRAICATDPDGGRHHLIVHNRWTDDRLERLVARRATGIEGCREPLSTDFDTPMREAVSDQGLGECALLTGLRPGDRFEIVASNFVDTLVVDADGNTVTAPLEGTGPWHLVAEMNRPEGKTYAVHRTTEPGGCTSLGSEAFAFSAPPIEREFTRELQFQCFTFEAGADETFRFDTEVPDSFGIASRTLYDPSGRSITGTTTAEAGTHTVVFRGYEGRVLFSPRALDDPQGCVPVSLSHAAPTIDATPAGGVLVRCFSAELDAGDVFRFRHRSNDFSAASLFLPGPDGVTTAPCFFHPQSEPMECAVPAGGTWRLLVVIPEYRALSGATIDAGAWRINDPIGCTDLRSSTLGFDQPHVVGRLVDGIDQDCINYDGVVGGRYWIQVASPDELSGHNFYPRAIHQSPVAGAGWCVAHDDPRQACLPAADGRQDVFVTRQESTGPANWHLSIHRLDDPTGCAGPIELGFDAQPIRGSNASQVLVDCVGFDAQPGDRLEITARPDGREYGDITRFVVGADGEVQCYGSGYQGSTTCTLEGDGPFHAMFSPRTSEDLGGYTATIQNRTTTEGCTFLDADDVSFGSLPLRFESAASTSTACVAFEGTAGQDFWIETHETTEHSHPSFADDPPFEVLDDQGDVICTGSSYERDDPPCTLPSSSLFRVTVPARAAGEEIVVNVKRITDPSGCTTGTGLAWDAPAVEGRLDDLGDIECHRIEVDAGDALVVAGTASRSRMWFSVFGPGVGDCAGTSTLTLPAFQSCTIDSTGEAFIVVRSDAGAGREAGTYWFSARRDNDGTGCTPLSTSQLGFDQPELHDSIDTEADDDCYVVDLDPGDRLRFDMVAGPPADHLSFSMVSPDGTSLCGSIRHLGYGRYGDCEATTSGPHLVTFEDRFRSNSMAYIAAIRRLNDPLGCTDAGDLADSVRGDGELSGWFDGACHTFSASVGDEFWMEHLVVDGEPVEDHRAQPAVAVLDADGQEVCSVTEGTVCTMSGPTPHALILVAEDSRSADYEFAARLLPDHELVPLEASRLLDTRRDSTGATKPRPAAGATVRFRAGEHGLPDRGVAGVAVTVSVGQATGPGYVTVWNCADPRPTAATVTHGSDGAFVSNLAVVGVTDGSREICVFTSRGAHVVVDLAAWSAADSALTSIAPTRILETRPTQVGYAGDKPVAGQVVRITPGDADAVPDDGVDAVAFTLTATASTSAGYVTAWDCDGDVPLAASLTIERADQTVSNLVLAEVGADGDVCLYTSGGTHLVVDVNAWVGTGASLQTLSPRRALETRSSAGQVGYDGPRPGDGQVTTVSVADLAGEDVRLVVANITVTETTGPGYVTAWPCTSPRPGTASMVVAGAGQTISSLAIVPVSDEGTICLYTHRSTHLIVDLTAAA